MSESPAWAKGYDVAKLKEITAIFKEHDKGMVHGAFGRYSEVEAAADLERGWLRYGEDWAVVARLLDRQLSVRDFTGDARITIPRNTFYISRVAWRGGGVSEVADEIDANLTTAVSVWQEHRLERDLVEHLNLAAVKISAASEMRGVYVSWDTVAYPPEQQLSVGPLPIHIAAAKVRALRDEAVGFDFASHYSTYNKADSWSAVALRGFFDDPLRIEKPMEMSRKWKGEHADELGNEVRDTPLRAQLPTLERILELIPNASLERVRLMRLAPGGGELARHADITDADAGAAVGRVVRIHVPLVTNPFVIFQSWDLDGVARSAHMEVGRAWYLDVRKAHTAVNGGDSERIHLVVDAVANEELVDVLRGAADAAGFRGPSTVGQLF